MQPVIYELRNGTDTSKYDVYFNKVDINDTRIIIGQSQFDSSWANPGKVEGILENNGDYVIITMGNKAVKLDYSQVEVVRLLLHANDIANKTKIPEVYPTKLTKFNICED